MKIVLVGRGKMGRMVEHQAVEGGDEVVACFDRKNPPHVKSSELWEADVCIDFTQPSAVLGNLEVLAQYHKPVVIGTTGWDVGRAERYTNEIGILYAPNFSLGMALFVQLLKRAHTLFSPYYDLSGIEIHHKGKKDALSGSAIHMAQKVAGLEFQSLRIGSEVGTHQVVFDALEERIELKHSAKNREVFAKGALKAARWLIGRVGLYTFEDVVEEMTGCAR